MKAFPIMIGKNLLIKSLKSLELPGMDGYGLDHETFTEILEHGYNLKVKGYRFYKVNKNCEDLY